MSHYEWDSCLNPNNVSLCGLNLRQYYYGWMLQVYINIYTSSVEQEPSMRVVFAEVLEIMICRVKLNLRQTFYGSHLRMLCKFGRSSYAIKSR